MWSSNKKQSLLQQLVCINNRHFYSHFSVQTMESSSWSYTEPFFESGGSNTVGGNIKNVLSCPHQYTTQMATLSMLTSYINTCGNKAQGCVSHTHRWQLTAVLFE